MKKINLDLFFHLGLLFFLGFLIWESRLYPFDSRFYPQVIGGSTIVLLLVSLVRHFGEKGREKTSDPLAVLRQRRFLQISFVVVLATVLGIMGGFIVGVLCYYVAYALFQKDRSHLVQTLSIGVALTILYYVSFDWFMKVPLLRGWLI